MNTKENNTGSDFSGVKVGDRLWVRCEAYEGWGFIDRIHPEEFLIKYETGSTWVYHDGKVCHDGPQVLFWDKVEIVPPPRPRRLVKKMIEVRPFLHSSGRIGLDYSQEINQVREHCYCGPVQPIEIEVEE